MKRHVALTLLALTTLGVLNAHVDLPQVDGRRFVQTQSRLYDPVGWLEDRWTTMGRDCSSVQVLGAGDRLYAGALRAIQEFSPPDSRSARAVQVQAAGPWLLAEVEFAQLSPAVVVLFSGQTVEVVEGAIWSGSTEPWRPAPLIRRHLAAKATGAPEALLDCYTPRLALFQPH